MDDIKNWKYNPADYNPDVFELIPVGEYRVRIEQCELKLAKSGKQMFQIRLAVSGHIANVWTYLVFDGTDEKSRKNTNQQLGSIYDSFEIPKGNLNPSDWKGKTGGAKIKHEMYNGEKQAKISYFLPRKKVDALPAWQEKRAVKNITQDTSVPDITAEQFDFNKGF